MAQAAVAFAKQMKRKQIFAVTSSVGPGAANMVTAAGTATANNIPVLILPGDVYACRQPDPVLQQVEQIGNLTVSTNDAFKAVCKYWDRVARPEQLMSAMQIEKGSAPQMQQGSSQKQQAFSANTSFASTYGMGDNKDKQNDSYLCSDVLSTEKHASSLYDTCIFEFKDEQVRSALNHIQKEEQNHGKMIYDYMQANNMREAHPLGCASLAYIRKQF